MEQKICESCNKSFMGNDEICYDCKINKGSVDDKMNRLASTIDTLATLKSYKELKK